MPFCYELRLHRARGYGALKAILDILADEEPLTLTEISQRLHRTPGSTKDYLSWLEDVDLVTSRQKRYSFTDPLLRLWVRLHCRPVAADRRGRRARSAALRARPRAAARAGARARLRRRRRHAGRAQELGNHRDRLSSDQRVADVDVVGVRGRATAASSARCRLAVTDSSGTSPSSERTRAAAPSRPRQRRLVQRPVHQRHPAIARVAVDRERHVPHAQPRVAALLDVARRPAEPADQKVAQPLLGARQIVASDTSARGSDRRAPARRSAWTSRANPSSPISA